MSFPWWPPDGPWPETPGGIRGPDGRNLTDLYNLIATTNTTLAEMLTHVSGINGTLQVVVAALDRLITPAATQPVGWPGLQAYLRQTLGSETAVGGDWLLPRIRQAQVSAADINNRLVSAGFGTGFPNPAGTAISGLAAHIARLQAIEAALGDLALVTGDVQGDPVGSTVKDLLRSMDANMLALKICCEEGGIGGDPTDEPNDPPSEFGCGGKVRQNGWSYAGPITIEGVVHDVLQPDFGSFFTENSRTILRLSGVIGGETRITYQSDEEPPMLVCLAWNFTGNATQPVAFGRNRAVGHTNAGEIFLSGPLGGGSTVIEGGLTDELESEDVDQLGYFFAFPVVEGPPPLNVFLGLQPLAS